MLNIIIGTPLARANSILGSPDEAVVGHFVGQVHLIVLLHGRDEVPD